MGILLVLGIVTTSSWWESSKIDNKIYKEAENNIRMIFSSLALPKLWKKIEGRKPKKRTLESQKHSYQTLPWLKLTQPSSTQHGRVGASNSDILASTGSILLVNLFLQLENVIEKFSKIKTIRCSTGMAEKQLYMYNKVDSS